MNDRAVLSEAVRSVRWTIYLVLLLNGIYIQWFAPFRYACSITGEECITCGLRTAVNLFLQGRFAESLASSKLIVVIGIGIFVMAVDVLYYLYQRYKRIDVPSISSEPEK